MGASHPALPHYTPFVKVLAFIQLANKYGDKKKLL
jgi:hypothetical protein